MDDKFLDSLSKIIKQNNKKLYWEEIEEELLQFIKKIEE